MRNTKIGITLFCTILFVVWGCKKSDDTQAQNSPTANSLPASLFLAAAPAGITPVADLKANAKEGDNVTIKVVVGGRKTVFVANRAVMTVIDASVENPCTAPGHSCPMPWDYCCTPTDQLMAHMASVQIVDADARPLSLDLSNVEKLKPLSVLVVQGTVGPRPDNTNLVINATGIFVEQQAG